MGVEMDVEQMVDIATNATIMEEVKYKYAYIGQSTRHEMTEAEYEKIVFLKKANVYSKRSLLAANPKPQYPEMVGNAEEVQIGDIQKQQEETCKKDLEEKKKTAKNYPPKYPHSMRSKTTYNKKGKTVDETKPYDRDKEKVQPQGSFGTIQTKLQPKKKTGIQHVEAYNALGGEMTKLEYATKHGISYNKFLEWTRRYK